MKKWITIYLLISCAPAFSQRFQEKLSVTISEPLTEIRAEWLSIDSDTLLDVVATGKNNAGELALVTFKNVNAQSLTLQSIQSTSFTEGFWQITDWNHDNQPDILFSGKTLSAKDSISVFIHQKDFQFQRLPQNILNLHSPFVLADLNNDGREDFIAYDETGVHVYQRVDDTYELKFDSVGWQVRDVCAFDFDKDGRNDWVASGLNQEGQPTTLLFINNGDFDFTVKPLPDPLNGFITSGDINQDGKFDLLATGTDEAGNNQHRIWHNNGTTFTSLRSAPSEDSLRLFAGDFTSDGILEQWLWHSNTPALNYLADTTFQQEPIQDENIAWQSAGDFDRDGDLDLLQVVQQPAELLLRVLENKTPQVNNRPSVPTQAFAISTFGKTYIFWQPPTDDHTATASLTYDVWLGTQTENLVMPAFSLSTARRNRTQHGNAGTNHFFIVDSLTDNRYFYQVQAVDNAYSGSYQVCSGGVLPCFDLSHTYVQACQNEMVALDAEGPAIWFSLSKGWIATGNLFNFTAIESDTLFSFVPQGNDCSKNKVWIIQVNEGPASEEEIIHACLNQTLRIGIAPGWATVQWNNDPLLTQDSLSVVVQKEEIILVRASNTGGCSYEKEFIIRPSIPQLELNGESFQIVRGQSVSLEATGTADHYEWTPPSGLDNAFISNPQATPLQTTTYHVTATDSIGCQAQAMVLVQVEEVAFVPNLFTPNGDGKNDALLIYGLTQASQFQFRIYNREGSVVFETNDVASATGRGWNGFVNGTRQPSGVYYWKVEGQTITGTPLLLNGKQTGSILLVH